MKTLTTREKLNILEDFDEGCELTDAIQSILLSTRILLGINSDIEADILTCVALKLVTEHCHYVRDEESKCEFEKLDDEVWELCMGYPKSEHVFDRS